MEEITEENFNEHFFDARKYGPKKDQVLAKFRAIAEFIEGQEKTDVINLLKLDKCREAVQVMQRLHGCKAPSSYQVLLEMSQDLLKMTTEEVNKKPYKMTIEFLFWTKKECIPNSPHWETLDVLSYDDEKGVYQSKIEI